MEEGNPAAEEEETAEASRITGAVVGEVRGTYLLWLGFGFFIGVALSLIILILVRKRK